MVKRLAFIATFSIAMSPVLAQTKAQVRAPHGSGGYLQDGRDTVVRNPFGLCWRSGTWTPADAVIGCDGQLAAPVANPIAPEPVSPAAVPQAQSQPPASPARCDFTVMLANDETFDFNRATLGKSARKRIDEEVISKLSGCAKVERVTILGHTDRLGAPQYNLRLSERRANAVANYLRKKGDFAKVETFGLGETQPSTSCEPRLPRRALIDCLAPDRRVVIELQGVAK